MSLEFKGKLIEKYETIQINDKFKKREFVLEHTEVAGENSWVSTPKFQLTQDKCSLIDSANIGDELNVQFNIRGNKWEKDGKINYFTNLEAWKIEVINNVTSETPPDLNHDNEMPF